MMSRRGVNYQSSIRLCPLLKQQPLRIAVPVGQSPLFFDNQFALHSPVMHSAQLGAFELLGSNFVAPRNQECRICRFKSMQLRQCGSNGPRIRSDPRDLLLKKTTPESSNKRRTACFLRLNEAVRIGPKVHPCLVHFNLVSALRACTCMEITIQHLGPQRKMDLC